MKIAEGLVEFRKLMLHWEYSAATQRTDLLRILAEQIDPVHLFVLEASEETRESFTNMKTSLQFAYWLLRNDVEAYQLFRGMSVQNVLREEMMQRRKAARGG